MLKDLSVSNYRCFRDFQVSDLAQVNLLVGMNNSGKTSLLEAIYLLVNQGDYRCLADLLRYRGELALPQATAAMGLPPNASVGYPINHLFHEHKIKPGDAIQVHSVEDTPLYLSIWLGVKETEQDVYNQEQIDNPEDIYQQSLFDLQLHFQYDSQHRKLQRTIDIRADGSIGLRPLPTAKKRGQTQRSLFLPTTNLNIYTLSDWWDEITLRPEEDLVIEALRLLQPDVERINFTGRFNAISSIQIKLTDQIEPIPLSSMGEGMQRLLALVMAIVNAEDGILLVDEIDTGLYYRVQKGMWRLIFEIAQRLNVQVFATTHSWDCVSAFATVMSELDFHATGKLIRLTNKGDLIHAADYTPQQLAIAIREDIEVR